MRVVFLGTSSFAVPALNELHRRRDITIEGVVSRPDRPAGRGRKLTRPPVALAAEKIGIQLHQPEKLTEIRTELKSIAPEVMVSASYGGWLPGWFLEAAPLGVVNIHPSLLPRHRGAAPVVRTVLSGDAVTGVTFMLTDSGWDTGPVIKAFPHRVDTGITAGELEEQLAALAAKQLPRVLLDYEGGILEPRAQSGDGTYAEKITPEEALMDWRESSTNLDRMVRAFNPVPGARTFFRGKMLKIFQAAPCEGRGTPGEIIAVNPLTAACGTGAWFFGSFSPRAKTDVRRRLPQGRQDKNGGVLWRRIGTGSICTWELPCSRCFPGF